MGYVIIGVVAFILGILTTMLCMHIKNTKKDGE